MQSNITKSSLRRLRNETGLSQIDFYRQLGVDQSAGSRYESNRIPSAIASFMELLRMVHVEQIPLDKINQIDLDVVRYLKEELPDLHQEIAGLVLKDDPGLRRRRELFTEVLEACPSQRWHEVFNSSSGE